MTTVTSSASAMDQPFESWLAPLLQCSDSAYPVGSFAHSFGLESMVQSGTVTEQNSLKEFLNGPVRHGLENIDFPILSHSYYAISAGNFNELIDLDCLSAACRTPAELKEASSRIGRQRMEILRTLWQEIYPVPEINLPHEQAPVVAGIEAFILGAPRRSAMAVYGHGSYAAILSASIKLLRLGQTQIQKILMECSQGLGSVIEESDGVSMENIGSFAPLFDTASMQHERCSARLFLS